MNRKCGPKKNNREIKFLTARPNGILRGRTWLVSIKRYFLAFEKCGAACWSLFGTPQRAPQGVLGDGLLL